MTLLWVAITFFIGVFSGVFVMAFVQVKMVLRLEKKEAELKQQEDNLECKKKWLEKEWGFEVSSLCQKTEPTYKRVIVK